MKGQLLKGNPRQIGLTHGTIFRQEIIKTLTAYLQLWGINPKDLPQRVQTYKDTIQTQYPHLAEEITGIAIGAKLPESYIYAINARTELMDFFDIPECTSTAIMPPYTKQAILAQNWDFINSLRDLVRVVEIAPLGKPRILTFIEPGMLAKIGLNENGLGVCLNFLETANRDKQGIPTHILLRLVLESENYLAAQQLIQQTRRASSANYQIADDQGSMANHETKPNTLAIMTGTYATVHTNSFDADGQQCTRKKTMQEILANCAQNRQQITPEQLKQAFQHPTILAQRNDTPGAVETLNTIIMNLTTRTMQVSTGARKGPYATYTFS